MTSYPIEQALQGELDLKIQMGKVPGFIGIHKFGSTETADTVLKDVWSFNFNKQYATVGVAMYIWSTDNTDTTEITINGLDENWQQKTEVVILTGNTPALIPGLWTRIFRARNLTPPPFVGTLYISRTTTAAPGAPLAADAEGSLLPLTQGTVMTHFTVPAGHTAFIKRFTVGTVKGKDIRAYGFNRTEGGTFRAEEVLTAFETTATKELPSLKFTEKSDFVIRALADVSNTFISATYDIILVQNDPHLLGV